MNKTMLFLFMLIAWSLASCEPYDANRAERTRDTTGMVGQQNTDQAQQNVDQSR